MSQPELQICRQHTGLRHEGSVCLLVWHCPTFAGLPDDLIQRKGNTCQAQIIQRNVQCLQRKGHNTFQAGPIRAHSGSNRAPLSKPVAHHQHADEGHALSLLMPHAHVHIPWLHRCHWPEHDESNRHMSYNEHMSSAFQRIRRKSRWHRRQGFQGDPLTAC